MATKIERAEYGGDGLGRIPRKTSDRAPAREDFPRSSTSSNRSGTVRVGRF